MEDYLPLKLLGHGHSLPARVVESAEVEDLCGLKRGWIEKRTGVRQRRWVEGETVLDLASEAAREALDDAGMAAGELDLIINASGTAPQAIPDGAHLLQRELGLQDSGISCMTVHTTCLSFLTALDTAASLMAAGRYRNVLIVSADIASCGINFKEPESAALFGDAAAAVVATRPENGASSGILSARMESYSSGAEYTEIRGGGTLRHPNRPNTQAEDNLFHMHGPQIYKMARQHAAGFLERLRPGLSKGPGSIKHVVPHQASILAVRGLRRYGVPDEMVSVNLDRYGNCVAASLPLTLYDAVRAGRIQRGDEVLLIGTGAGLCFGGIILRY
jgi:3-oxoacyl-[acyl-carrier-protein] synthase-3